MTPRVRAASEDSPDSGRAAPDAGDTAPDPGEADPDAGDAAPDAAARPPPEGGSVEGKGVKQLAVLGLIQRHSAPPPSRSPLLRSVVAGPADGPRRLPAGAH